MTHILLAEDNQVDAIATTEYLKNNLGDFDVHNVKSCVDLLEHLESTDTVYDVIILDHILEDEQSLKYIEKIIKKAKGAEIVVLSGQSDISVCIQYLNAGVYAYLNKENNSYKNLVKNINDILAKKRGEVQYFKINRTTFYIGFAVILLLLTFLVLIFR